MVYRRDLCDDANALPRTLPVVCVHGERDMTIPADGVRKLAVSRSNWAIHTLPRTDHHPWLRVPEFCAGLVFGGLKPA